MILLALKELNLAPILEQPNIELILSEHNDYNLFKKINDELLKNHTFYNLRNFSFFYNVKYYDLNREHYQGTMQVFNRSASYVVMYYGNDAKDSFIGVHNMFANLREIQSNPGVNLLMDKFKGVPAICVASGPSLDKNIEQLRGLDKKALIICADASLQPLLKKGIKSNMVTSLEREIEVVDLFKDIKEDYSNTYLCACPVVYNKVYQVYNGPRIIVYRSFDHFKWLGIDRGMLEIKVSPGNMNFKIAEYLGCDPIILVGQDLCIYENQTNVSNTPLGNNQKTYTNEPKIPVEGNYEKEVTSTRSLNLMLEAFVMDVAQTETTVVNSTEGGARIPGTKIMTLKEAIDKYLKTDINVEGILNHNLSKFVKNEGDIKKVQENIDISIRDFKKAIAVCDSAIYSLKDLKKLNDEECKKEDKYISKEFEKVLDAKSSLSESDFTWQLYFAHIAQSVFINHEMELNSLSFDYDDIYIIKYKYLKKSLEFFKIIRGLVLVCVDDLKTEQERISKNV